jgi:hypothetical protein
MDRYGLEVVDGALVADTTKLLPGPDRGASEFRTEPRGPSCAKET